MRVRKEGLLNVYLISTSGRDGSFFEVRKRIFDIIENKLGLCGIGYERPDYVNTDARTLTENCLNNMNGADMFVIVLNERYGYVEPGDKRSVTHSEIEAALRSNKPCLVFAQRELIALADLDPTERGEEIKAFFGSEAEYGEKQIDLVREISKHHVICDYPMGNHKKLYALVKSRIIGFSPYFINKFVSAQRTHVEGSISTECFGSDVRRARLSYSVRDTDPEFDGLSMSSRICDLVGRGSVVVEGESGTGKTVTLRTAFIDMCFIYEREKTWSREPVPVYLEFRSFKTKHFHLRKYISGRYKSLLGHGCPSFVLDRIVKECGVCIFADALDEWRFSDDYADLDRMIATLGERFVLSVRRSTYRRVEERLSTMTHPCMMVTVHGWTEREVRSYATSVLGDPVRAAAFTDRLVGIMSKKGGAYYSPFLVSMAVHHLSLDEGERIVSVGHLMRESVRGCILKDLQKRGITVTDELLEAALLHLTHVATFVYTTRYNGGRFDSIPELMEYLADRPVGLDPHTARIVRSVFYTFNEGRDRFYPKHLMILYYFLADFAVKRIREHDFAFFARYSFNSEINRMIANLSYGVTLREMGIIIDRACEYSRTLSTDEERLIFYYFIPRLAGNVTPLMEQVSRFLNSILSEGLGLWSIAVYNWLTQYGDTDAEEEYLRLVRTDERFAAWQRGSYLIYQGDRPEQKFGFADDDGETDWLSTATSFIEHFRSGETRHRFIRRVDIATVISFLTSGKDSYSVLSDYFLSLDEDELVRDYRSEPVKNTLESNGISVEERCDDLAALLSDLKAVILATERARQ